MWSNEQEFIKRLLIKKIHGTITSDEDKKLQNLIGDNNDYKILAEHVLSNEFLQKAILDRNRNACEKGWRELYQQLNFTRKNFFIGSFYRWTAVVLLLIIIGIGIFIYYGGKKKNVIITPGSCKAALHWKGEKLLDLGPNDIDYIQILNELSAKESIVATQKEDLAIVVPRRGEYKIILEDGSYIHLNAGTKLTIPSDFSLTNRHINLAGEAYMVVQKDSLNPFTIRTKRADILVRGTKLNIKDYPDENKLEVVLEEGQVAVSYLGDKKEMRRGEKIVINEKGESSTQYVDVDLYTAWHNNRIVFYNESLENIMHELGRWYNFETFFSHDHLRNLKFTINVNKFKTFNELANMMKEMDEINISIKQNRVLISEKQR